MKNLLVLPALLLALIPISARGEGEASKLRIGVIVPLTGGVATWGKSVRAAIELANSRGAQPAELFFEDEETCSAAKALAAYTVLRSVRKVDVLVASCLEGAQAIAPLARRDKMPFFISGRSSHDFQNQNPNALSWLSLLDYEGDAIAKLVVGSSRVDLQACKLEYSIVSPK